MVLNDNEINQNDFDFIQNAKIRLKSIINTEEKEVFDRLLFLLKQDKYHFQNKPEFHLLSQVSLGAIFSSKYKKAFWAFNKRRFDFLIIGIHNDFLANNKNPMIAIEYHGSGHYQAGYEKRDMIKRVLCKKAGLHLVEINSDNIDDKLSEIESLLDKLQQF